MEKKYSTLYNSCKTTLEENWHDTHTIPAAGLYPHQWLWDSGFNAIGWSHINTQKAQQEIRHLFSGQWANGMIPHMIFAEGSNDKRLWQSKRNPYAPSTIDTSGITQPPVIAEAVVQIGSKLPTVEKRQWYHDTYAQLLKYHEWLYADRGTNNEGLVRLIHPWESGFDSNPAWIQQLHENKAPWWVLVTDNRVGRFAIHNLRNDRHIPPGQRLDDIDASLYQHELVKLVRKDWDIDRIKKTSTLQIEDLAFNSILIRANTRLREIAETIGHDIPRSLLENMSNTQKSLEKLWDTGHHEYFSRNAITKKLIKQSSIMDLMPLYAGSVKPERAALLVKKLYDKKQYACTYPIPSVPFSSTYYQEKSYWQGPTWINTNWMIADGLKRYGYIKEAESIIKSSIALVEHAGPCEYFSALSGEPAGAEKFSWTAALIIDFIHQMEKQ